MKTRPQQALNSLKQTTILTLMIGQKLEKVYIYPDCNIKAISLSIVQKHNLATEAVYFLEENIRNQLKKLQTSKKSNISQKSSSNTSPRNRQILTARSQIKFYEELYDKGIGVLRKRKEKAEIFKKNQEISMLKEVTFRPKITSYHTSTNKSQISYSPIRNRDISENLYENGLKLMEKKQMSSEKFRDESFKKQCSFKPIICEKSKQIVQGKGNANIKDFSKRLYKIVDHSQWREEKIKEFYPFKPELINKGRIKEKKNNSFRKTIEEKDEEKINHSPKIRKDAYYFKAKQNENDEMLRFRKKIASIEKNEANFLRKKSQVRNLEKEASISEKEAKIIFNLLDSDNDNIISAKYIDLTQIHPFLLEIIQEVLFEMEAQNTSLSFQDFYKKMKKFMLEKKILEYFEKNQEKIDCFHHPQFSFGDYSENMLFLKKSNLDIEQTTKREKTKEKLTSFITKHYKNIIKTSFDN